MSMKNDMMYAILLIGLVAATLRLAEVAIS